jgi:hypothetical protein
MLILVSNIELAYNLAAFYDPRLKNPRPGTYADGSLASITDDNSRVGCGMEPAPELPISRDVESCGWNKPHVAEAMSGPNAPKCAPVQHDEYVSA